MGGNGNKSNDNSDNNQPGKFLGLHFLQITAMTYFMSKVSIMAFRVGRYFSYSPFTPL